MREPVQKLFTFKDIGLATATEYGLQPGRQTLSVAHIDRGQLGEGLGRRRPARKPLDSKQWQLRASRVCGL